MLTRQKKTQPETEIENELQALRQRHETMSADLAKQSAAAAIAAKALLDGTGAAGAVTEAQAREGVLRDAVASLQGQIDVKEAEATAHGKRHEIERTLQECGELARSMEGNREKYHEILVRAAAALESACGEMFIEHNAYESTRQALRERLVALRNAGGDTETPELDSTVSISGRRFQVRTNTTNAMQGFLTLAFGQFSRQRSIDERHTQIAGMTGGPTLAPEHLRRIY